MVQLHFDRNAVTCKIVYYGPGLSGKTTNLEQVHQKAPQDKRGEMVSIATRGDRTLYFDYLPLDLGTVSGMQTTFQLYTVPGQIYYNNTRKLVLQGVDGVVFVADSAADKLDENRESLANLRDNLNTIGINITDLPIVFQFNKRDIPGALSVNELNAALNPGGAPAFEAVAKDGQGVFATLKDIGRLVIERVNKEAAPGAARRRSTANVSAPPVGAQPSPASLPKGTPIPRATPQPAKSHPSTRPMPTPPPVPTPHAGIRSPAPRSPVSGTAATGEMVPVPKKSASRPSANAPTEDLSPSAQAPTRRQASPPSPKERHLLKAKPPSLQERRRRSGDRKAPDVDLGPTDPHLKKYRNRDDSDEVNKVKGGFSLIRVLVATLLALMISLVVVVALLIFVEPVRQSLGQGLPPNIKAMLGVEEPEVQAPSRPTSGDGPEEDEGPLP